MQVDNSHFQERPKRVRRDSQRQLIDINPDEKRSLGLTGVIHVLKSYDDFDGGINCCICGKLYKSKVCFTKHIWEHSVYWDKFKGEKNHDRVLSIQAALILYGNNQGNPFVPNDNCCSEVSKMLPELLVTSPNEKKKDVNGNISPEKLFSPTKRTSSPTKRPSPRKSKSPAKRKKNSTGSEGSQVTVSHAKNETLQNSSPMKVDSDRVLLRH